SGSLGLLVTAVLYGPSGIGFQRSRAPAIRIEQRRVGRWRRSRNLLFMRRKTHHSVVHRTRTEPAHEPSRIVPPACAALRCDVSRRVASGAFRAPSGAFGLLASTGFRRPGAHIGARVGSPVIFLRRRSPTRLL